MQKLSVLLLIYCSTYSSVHAVEPNNAPQIIADTVTSEEIRRCWEDTAIHSAEISFVKRYDNIPPGPKLDFFRKETGFTLLYMDSERIRLDNHRDGTLMNLFGDRGLFVPRAYFHGLTAVHIDVPKKSVLRKDLVVNALRFWLDPVESKLADAILTPERTYEIQFDSNFGRVIEIEREEKRVRERYIFSEEFDWRLVSCERLPSQWNSLELRKSFAYKRNPEGQLLLTSFKKTTKPRSEGRFPSPGILAIGEIELAVREVADTDVSLSLPEHRIEFDNINGYKKVVLGPISAVVEDKHLKNFKNWENVIQAAQAP